MLLGIFLGTMLISNPEPTPEAAVLPTETPIASTEAPEPTTPPAIESTTPPTIEPTISPTGADEEASPINSPTAEPLVMAGAFIDDFSDPSSGLFPQASDTGWSALLCTPVFLLGLWHDIMLIYSL